MNFKINTRYGTVEVVLHSSTQATVKAYVETRLVVTVKGTAREVTGEALFTYQNGEWVGPVVQSGERHFSLVSFYGHGMDWLHVGHQNKIIKAIALALNSYTKVAEARVTADLKQAELRLSMRREKLTEVEVRVARFDSTREQIMDKARRQCEAIMAEAENLYASHEARILRDLDDAQRNVELAEGKVQAEQLVLEGTPREWAEAFTTGNTI